MKPISKIKAYFANTEYTRQDIIVAVFTFVIAATIVAIMCAGIYTNVRYFVHYVSIVSFIGALISISSIMAVQFTIARHFINSFKNRNK